MIHIALPTIITVTILVSLFFFFLTKSLSFLQNSLLFMVISILTKNISTLMSLNWKVIHTTEDQFLFLFFLINREILIPLLVLIFVNIYLRTPSGGKRIIIYICSIPVIAGLNFLSEYFNVIDFVKITLFHHTLVDTTYFLIGIGLAKIICFDHWEHRHEGI
ncbi:hypothetical protein [Bacillus sp. Marseille-Q3570]|uniref:hypothetical protein n=1 Tax=Bacillus sp. Marseille-Q3570 TaxID=2963522 RepID=UPI0021B84B0D|nr:hypothetical protein [Bacillus sp. Marseille-Q3570]